MKMLHKYSEKETKTLLNSLILLSDTREKDNRHILQSLDEKGIQHKEMKLDTGDYSFVLPMDRDLGINRDMYFDNEIVVERKRSLEELSNNLAQERQRFENEMLRYKGKFILLIEDGSYTDIFWHTYKTDLNEKAYFASLMSFKARYNIDIEFVDKRFTWYYIYYSFYYYLRNWLKG